MEEVKQIPIQGSEEEVKANDDESLETVLSKKKLENVDSGKQEAEEAVDEVIESVVNSVEEAIDSVVNFVEEVAVAGDPVEDSINVNDKLSIVEAENKTEKILKESNGFSPHSNGFEEENRLPAAVNKDPVEQSVETDAINPETETKAQETEETIVEIAKETEQKIEETEEKIMKLSEESNGFAAESNVLGQSTFPDSDAKNVEYGGVDIPVKDVSEELQAAASNEGSSSRAIDLADKQNTDESKLVQTDESCNVVERSKEVEIPDNINQPIISVTSGTIRPTSWRSCCGLFEVLRRSNR